MAAKGEYEPRLTSVLSADVVEYSRLIDDDRVRTVMGLRACHNILKGLVKTHGGRIFGRAGDSFMVEIPQPAAAVRCAVALQGRLRQRNCDLPETERMWLRVGVSFGEVIEDEGALHGQRVNIAVRLQEACPRDSVVICDALYARLGSETEFGFRPLGELPLKHIEQPIAVYEIIMPESDLSDSTPAMSVVDLRQPVPGFAGRPALAVLPFENENPDAGHLDYLSDGFSEDLTTRLSHLRWCPIIDRNSSFAFRGATTSSRRIGRLLGARYLLQGGLCLSGDHMRVTARLIDSEAAYIFWSQTYEMGLSDLHATLDEVATSIIAMLESRIARVEQGRARARRRSRLDTWGMIWRGRWHLNRLTSADAAEARRLFTEAVKLDPESAEAQIHLAWWTWYDVWSQRRPREDMEALRELTLRALAADVLDSRGHLLAGSAEILLRRPEQALRHLEEAVRLNPSLAYAHAQIGSSHMLAGRPRDAIVPLKTSLRLNPQDHYAFYALGELAAVHCMMGDWQQAIALADKSLSLRSAYWFARLSKIGALARSGDEAAAACELDTLLAQHPGFSRTYIEWLPFEDRAWIDYFAEGLVMAKSGKTGLDAGERSGIDTTHSFDQHTVS